MRSPYLLWAVTVVSGAGNALARTIASNQSAGHEACSQLVATFPALTFYPQSPTYSNESTRLWSETCLLSPSCVFTPRSAADVGGALSVIRKTKSQFSVRSGGHMPVPGAASTDGGVMIGMTNLDTRNLAENNSIAQIGPGQIWDQVYSWLSSYGLAVPGGRYGQVGVGGLLLGGGINYFGNRVGWSADAVVRYEVVLANSSVVEVSANSYADLFWALKGGNNNFGIVTRFDVKTLPITTAYVGGIVWPAAGIDPFLDAVGSFVLPGGGSDDPFVAINPAIALTPENGTIEATNIVFHQGSDPLPASLANFTAISGAFFNDTGVRPSWASLATELNQPAFAARTSRQLFWSTATKATPEAISLTNTTIVDAALQQLNHVANCTLTVAFQPITRVWLQAARDAGGDAIDLDPADGSFISVLISTTWSSAADDDVVRAAVSGAVALLEQRVQAIDAYYPFVYLNDAGPGQTPYQFYGNGKSLPRLLAIRQEYDPEGVFGSLEASGFKL